MKKKARYRVEAIDGYSDGSWSYIEETGDRDRAIQLACKIHYQRAVGGLGAGARVIQTREILRLGR